MTRIVLLVVVLSVAANPLWAGEAPHLGEQDLKHASILAGEGDTQAAVALLFKVLRQADNKDLRSDAREQLEKMGFSGPEIFQFDTASLKPEDWDKLLTRLAATTARRRRLESDIEYSKELLRAAVTVRIQQDGSAKLEVQTKDLAQALELVLHVALAETGGEEVREAQSRLEELGIAGPQVEAVRKCIAEGKLPPAVQNEIVCGLCLRLLEKYRGWLEEREEHEDQAFRKQLAQRLGSAICKYVVAQFAQTAIFKRPSDQLDFWREMSAPRKAEAEKTF